MLAKKIRNKDVIVKIIIAIGTLTSNSHIPYPIKIYLPLNLPSESRVLEIDTAW